MSDVPASKANIQVEESRFRYAVSESFAQKVGGSINFLNDFQHSEKQFFLNGRYWSIGTLTGMDGMVFFQFNATIIDVWMFVQKQTGATGSFTEIDLKRATTEGGPFTSIFSTTPRINGTAGDYIWTHVGASVTGTRAPVLSTANVNAGDAIRCDLVATPTGSPPSGSGCGILIHYLPR